MPPSPDPVLVIGSGITGLTIALELAEGGRAVRLVCKGPLSEGNTRYAQGGMAVALSGEDSPQSHLEDTLVAGAGLCEEAAVRVLTEEAPARYRDLVARGVDWDQEGGAVALTLEGAHRHRRVVHAKGDATGSEIERALVARLRAHPGIAVDENAFVVDLRVEGDRCVGAWVAHGDRVEAVSASSVVLAAGGCGRVYQYTTNPAVATGDGVAMAYRAGAAIRDVEFIQFHPTALHLPGKPTFLISEAVRGEGAVLRNMAGTALMGDVHPMRDLAPRDVVARAIARQMASDGTDHVWLDLSHLDPEMVAHRFPTISRVCAENGICLPLDRIPVAPAAHYVCGGVATDLAGRTTLAGLYAAGEVAWTGVHGANRLASNSLLECVVFGHRLAGAILAGVDPAAQTAGTPTESHGSEWHTEAPSPVVTQAVDPQALAADLPQFVWDAAGLMRDEPRLAGALPKLEAWLAAIERDHAAARADRGLGELRNMLTVSWLIAKAAHWRQESRGCHFRLDHPEADDQWKKHLTLSRPTATACRSTPS
ncbi:MAG: L-aspartate oxidase [Candidatus Sericytochromatia bacterium]